MKKCILFLFVFLIIGKSAGNELQIEPNDAKFDPRAIVMLNYLDWRQNSSGMIKGPKVAFAIGDGTLLLTAAHCVDDFYTAPDEPVSIDMAVISPYYGDMYDFKILAVDKQADIAILKAPWPAHPALELATEEEFAEAANILIASRPQANLSKTLRIGREIKTELLPVLHNDGNVPAAALRLKGTKYVVPGWSGSPMLIPGSGRIAGILTRCIVGIKTRLFGLITVNSRNDAAGNNIFSIRELINRKRLRQEAFAVPQKLEDIPDAEQGFSLAIDFFDALMNKNDSNAFQIASEFTELRPNSVQAHLLLALSSTIIARDPNVSASEYLNKAEASYKKALQIDSKSAHVHAVYGGFLQMTHRNTEALEQCNASLAIDPNNRMAMFNKLMIIEPNERKEAAEQYLSIEPNNPRVLFYYSDALSATGENEKALEAAQKAVSLDPNGLFEGALADALANLHRLDEAEPYYKQMAEKCGCQLCCFKYSSFLVRNRKDKLDEAKKFLEKAESLSHTKRVSVININLLKLDLMEKTEPQQGEILANELLKATPDNGHYWYMFAGILRTLEKYQEAAEAAQKGVDLCPDRSYRPRLANCLAKVGELEKAEQVYDDLHKEFPDRYAYWFWYAEFLVDYFDDRIDEAKRALEKVPYNQDSDWSVPADDLKKLHGKISAKSKELSVTPR